MKFKNTRWAEQLNRLSELEDGWLDGDDGTAISDQALTVADKILHALDSPTLSAPGLFASVEEGGGISMGWVDYRNMRTTGDFNSVTCHLTNDCGNYDIAILEHRPEAGMASHPDSFQDTNLETTSFEEALEFLRNNLERLGFYSA